MVPVVPWLPGLPGVRGILGDPGRCGFAGRGTPAALGRGASEGPLHGVRSEFCEEFNHAAPSGAPLQCLAAHPWLAFGRSLLFGPGKAAGVRIGGVRGGLGGRGVVGSRAWERLRRGRGAGGGPRHGKDSGFFPGNSTKLRLPAHSCCSTGTSMPRHSALPCSSVRGRWRGIRGSFGNRGGAGSRA